MQLANNSIGEFMNKSIIVLIFMLISATCLAGEKILYFGDSQSQGHFGTLMAQELEKSDSLRCSGVDDGNSNEVFLYARGSSSPRHWSDKKYSSGKGGWLCGKTWKTYKTGQGVGKVKGENICKESKKKKVSVVQHLVQKHNPDRVVFQFLGNSMFYVQNAYKFHPNDAQKRKKYLDKYFLPNLQNMIDPIGSRKCSFIISNPNHVSKTSRNKWRFKLQEVFKQYLYSFYPQCNVVKGMSDETMSSIAADETNFISDKIHLSEKGAETFKDYASEKLCSPTEMLKESKGWTKTSDYLCTFK